MTDLLPADLTILKMAVNGHEVPWIAQASQTSIAEVTHVLKVNGPGRDEWRAALAAYDQRGVDLPERAPLAPVTRIDLRGQEQPRALAVVPLPPEPAMTAAPALDHDERCGSEMTGGGAPHGWVLIRVVGGGAPKRWCSPECAVRSLRRPKPSTGRVTKDGRAAKGNTEAGRTSQGLAKRLSDLGLSARQVKQWAVEQGLLAEIKQGSVAGHLIDAYLAAHTTGATA